MKPVFKLVAWSMEDMERKWKKRAARDKRVGPADPRHSTMIKSSAKWLCVYWGGYEYAIEAERMRTHAEILGWVHHLSLKDWEHTTPKRIGRFIEIACHRAGIDAHT